MNKSIDMNIINELRNADPTPPDDINNIASKIEYEGEDEDIYMYDVSYYIWDGSESDVCYVTTIGTFGAPADAMKEADNFANHISETKNISTEVINNDKLGYYVIAVQLNGSVVGAIIVADSV